MEGYAALGNLLPIIDAELWPYLGGLVAEDREPPDTDDAPLTWAEVQGFQIAPDVGAAARQQQDAAFDEFWQNAHEAGNFVARWATSPIQAASLLGYRLAEGFAQGVTAPQRMAEIQQQYDGDWYAATRDPRMVAEAMNFAGMLSLGPIATRVATRPLGSPEVSVPSRPHDLYDPPTGQATPFAEIYPNGAVTDEAGRLIFDRDGRPIHPDAIVVGRRVGGGGSEAFPPGEYDALGTRLTGRNPAYTARSTLEGDSGRYNLEYDEVGNYTGRGAIGIADDLSGDQRRRHTAHEVAHAIDLRAVPPANRQEFSSRQFGIRPPDPDMDIEANFTQSTVT